MSHTNEVPPALHRGIEEVPFADVGDGSKFRVLMVDSDNGLWIVENIFPAGYRVQTHRHTGPIYGYTTSGAWKYVEYPEINRAGSFLFEPAGSVHTLEVLEDNTRVWFQMYGVNVNLAPDGSMLNIIDGRLSLLGYRAFCLAAGVTNPEVIEK